MTTPAQEAANRRNAAKSTGPRTDEGKARSSANALTHGGYALRVDAITASIPGEAPDEVQALIDAIIDELDPLTPLEEMAASTVATRILNRMRVDRLTAPLAEGVAPIDQSRLVLLPTPARHLVEQCTPRPRRRRRRRRRHRRRQQDRLGLVDREPAGSRTPRSRFRRDTALARRENSPAGHHGRVEGIVRRHDRPMLREPHRSTRGRRVQDHVLRGPRSCRRSHRARRPSAPAPT